MLIVPKEKLLEKLNVYAREALKNACSICIERAGFEVTIEHLLIALMTTEGSDVFHLLKGSAVSVAELQKKITSSFEYHKTGATELPAFSPLLLELMQDALIISDTELDEKHIRTGALFIALLRNPSRYCHFSYYGMLADLDENAMVRGFHEIVRAGMENAETAANKSGEEQTQIPSSPSNAQTALSKFGRDITADAAENKIDPVFCRDSEITLMIDALCRRRKNNPILVGDPGVGKTALAEGLALRIHKGDVPPALQGARLWELDLGALQAGASVKGEFERRLKSVLNEVSNSTQKIVLFIDEAHTLIGSGGNAGGGDAANLLKPALARGQLRAIAATTWAEYKKYFEKDAALSRRFQLVKLDEPDPASAVTILRGLRPAYEAQHRVYISEAALEAAAYLTDRYVSGRQLPDKALDVLDTACVRVAAGQSTRPVQLEYLQQRIRMLERAEQDRLRDAKMHAPLPVHSQSGETGETLPMLQAQADALAERWAKENELVEGILELRKSLEEPQIEQEKTESEITQQENSGKDPCRVAKEDEDQVLQDLIRKLDLLRGNETPLVQFEVGAAAVAQVVADWTHVPVAAMSEDNAEKLGQLGQTLKNTIIGQDEALTIIHDRLKAARLDLIRETSPRGVFLLTGPSGVGKTETALQVAETLFGGSQFLTTVNMSEYQEQHSVSRLIGSPPGYVGFGEGGVLTEALRRMPYSVVLLDEVEKAHPDVLNLFFQVFDKGTLTDGEGREINCRNAVFFLTSNLGSEALMQNRETVENASQDALEAAIRPHLTQFFKPALLARMRILCYKPLSQAALQNIICLKLEEQSKRMQKLRHIKLEWTPAAVDVIASHCSHSENGARMIDQIIERRILSAIADETLFRMVENTPLELVKIDGHEGGFLLEFTPGLPENPEPAETVETILPTDVPA